MCLTAARSARGTFTLSWKPYRPPRTGVFLNANPETTPLALRANFEHNNAVHETVVIVTVETLKVPHVHARDRLTVDDLGYRDDGITHLTLRHSGLPHRKRTTTKNSSVSIASVPVTAMP
jgi:K+ transporter